MKKILSFLLLFSIAIGYSQNYVAVTDKCPLISFSETNLQNISANKADIKLTQTSSQVIVNIIGGGNQAIYWSVAQARAYGYSLDSLYNHILDILKVQCDTSGGGGVSQTLSISGDTLSISGGNSVNLNRKADTSYFFRNSILDSLCQITIINGISYRSCAKDSVGAGSSTMPISSLTDATANDSINNANYRQAWTWNSLNNNSGLKLSSTSAGGGSGTIHRLFESTLSGALIGSGTVSYAGFFKNTQTVGAGIGLYVEGATQAIQATGYITSSNEFNIVSNSTTRWRNINNFNIFQTDQSNGHLFANNAGAFSFYNYAQTSVYFTLKSISSSRQVLIFNGDYNGSNFRSEGTSVALIERNTGKLIFSASTGESGSYANFTPKNIMTVQGGTTEALGNVGIGTTSPVASAKLELSSTTMGFLPPRMTSTQASAISSPAQGLMLFVTDTDGTFTSVGWWGYNGATWEKLNN